MGEHGGHKDAGKSEGVIVKSSKVEVIDGSEELLFQFLMQGGSKGEFGKFRFEHVDKFIDNKLGSTGWYNRGVTRMHRELEGNTGKCEVVSGGHDEAKVTMAATAMSGWDGAHIGINFLGEEFE